MAFKDNTITIEFTVTRDYSYSDSADVVAKALGISVTRLRKIVNGDDELMDVMKLDSLMEVSDCESETFEMNNIDEEEMD